MINIWSERLSTYDIFYFLCQAIFEGITVHYDERNISRLTQSFLGALNKIKLDKRFHRACLSLESKDSSGYSLNYRFQRNLDNAIEGFLNTSFSDKDASSKRIVKSFIALYLYPRVAFITMAEASSEFKNNHTNGNIFYLARHPLNSVIVSFYKDYSFKQSLFSWQGIIFYLRPYHHLALILLSKILFKGKRTSISEPRPAVWIEYCRNDIIDFTFWRNNLDKEHFDIVYYMDRPDSPATGKTIKAIENRGLKWIDLSFLSLAAFANIGPREIRTLLKIIFSRQLLFKKIFEFEFNIWFLLYRKVFGRFNVKIIIQHQELSWIQAAQAKAIGAAGGIMLGFHWSAYQFYREVTSLFPQHVYFVWGKAMYEHMQKRSGLDSYFLPSGLWTTNNVKDKEGLEDINKKFGFVIAVFDSSVAYNLYQTPDSLSNFYLRIFELLEKNNSWIGIIKSKERSLRDFIRLPKGEVIVDKMKAFIRNNRLKILDPTYMPDAAFRLADLSVCYNINSAGIIAGICGFRAIHWDCSGWLHHPIYKDPEQKIVYSDLDSFEDAIIKAGNGDRTIGDFSNWRRKFNYFGDLMATKRVGGFVQSFMDEVVKTGDNKKSLDSAVKNYIEQNRIGDDFYASENLWREE